MKRTAKTNRSPKATLEAAVIISLLRTADALSRDFEVLLKSFNLSPAQYNVLRILRGAGEKGLACREIAGRLISRDPDITRLLDKLDSRGLIARTRETRDRRVVTTRITKEGLQLLAGLDEPMSETHRSQLGHVPEKKLRQLAELLDLAREQTKKGDSPE